MKYSSDGKIGFNPDSPSIKKVSFVCKQSLFGISNYHTHFRKVMKGPQRRMMCESYWLRLLGNKQEPKTPHFHVLYKISFPKIDLQAVVTVECHVSIIAMT